MTPMNICSMTDEHMFNDQWTYVRAQLRIPTNTKISTNRQFCPSICLLIYFQIRISEGEITILYKLEEKVTIYQIIFITFVARELHEPHKNNTHYI